MMKGLIRQAVLAVVGRHTLEMLLEEGKVDLFDRDDVRTGVAGQSGVPAGACGETGCN